MYTIHWTTGNTHWKMWKCTLYSDAVSTKPQHHPIVVSILVNILFEHFFFLRIRPMQRSSLWVDPDSQKQPERNTIFSRRSNTQLSSCESLLYCNAPMSRTSLNGTDSKGNVLSTPRRYTEVCDSVSMLKKNKIKLQDFNRRIDFLI